MDMGIQTGVQRSANKEFVKRGSAVVDMNGHERRKQGFQSSIICLKILMHTQSKINMLQWRIKDFSTNGFCPLSSTLPHYCHPVALSLSS
jgi:hypothetical protein